MSWQQNVVLQRPVGGPEGREERPFTAPNGNSEDSSILRYIKTLTSHQTNAKQQRMDRYLRQVKHPQPADKSVAQGPKPLPTTGNKHQPIAKSLISQLQKNNLPKVLQHEPKARSDRGKTAGRKSKGRPQAKRQYEGAQSHRQRKKVKETPTSQQNTGIGSLDRFRLNGTWSQDKTQTTVTAKRDEISETRPATVRSAECMKGTLPAQGSPTRAQVSTGIPGTMKSRFWPSVATPGQCFGPVPLGPFRPSTLGTSEDPPSKLSQLNSLLPPKENQEASLKDAPTHETHEVLVNTYDPLCAIMESIYF